MVMVEKKGRFERGQWVVNVEPDPTIIDKRLTEATKSVITSIDDVMKFTHDIVTTPEGRQYIEKTLKDTQVHIQKSFDEILTRVKAEVDKQVKMVK